MILHNDGSLGCTLVEHIPKIYQRRSKSDGIYREAAKNVEFDWKDLICTHNFNWNSHGKVLKFILWRNSLILSDQVLLACLKNGSIRSELQPDLKMTFTLNVTESRIELKILFEIFWEEQLNLHGVLRSVV